MFKFLIFIIFLYDVSFSDLIVNRPELLPDGIFLMQSGDVVTSGGNWIILVTIDAPQVNHFLLARLKDSEAKIENAYQQLNRSNPFFKPLRTIISSMMIGTGPPSISQLRQKRGLFNFIGSISHSLFGLVTETELGELTDVVLNLQNSSANIIHNINSMVTAINGTANHAHENRRHIFKLQTATDKLFDAVALINNQITKNEREITNLKIEDCILETFIQLQFIYQSWLHSVDKYYRQRENLESGQLTEDILNPIDLNKILQQGQELGFDTLPQEWYFSHIRIEPLWEEGHRLVFRAKIPFIDTVKYIRYSIQTYPVPGILPNTTIQILTESDIALNTRSGEIFYPKNCIGHTPMVCTPSALYNDERLSCPRGIINGHDDLRESCRVRVTSVHSPRTDIDILFDRIHIVVTAGEFYLVHCSDTPEERHKLPPGAYRLTVKKQCSISGKGWSINGILEKSSRVMYHISPMDIVPFHLPNMTMTPAIQSHVLTKPHWANFSPPLSIKIKELQEIPIQKFTWGSHVPHISWISLIIGTVLFVFLTFACVFKFRIRIRKALFGKCATRAAEAGTDHTKVVQPSAPFQIRAPSFRLPCIYPAVSPAIIPTTETTTSISTSA